MFCENCKHELNESDFVNNQKFCYKCVFRIKQQKIEETRKSHKRICRECGKEIIVATDEKKRQRNIFCSQVCAEIGHKKQLNNHWTRKVFRTIIFK